MKIIVVGTILGVIAAAAWWAFSPLLFNVEVHDELPILDQTVNIDTEDHAVESMASGPFPIIETSGHPASGSLRIIKTHEGSIVRYENYEGTNGPDLKIYLANDLEATEYVSLGGAKGNIGNINYAVPSNIDIMDYRYVLTWCEAFGVLFDYAEIN